MSMSKKDFIALADAIRNHNEESKRNPKDRIAFQPDQILCLQHFCFEQNSKFNTQRWLGYIAGENGKNGGKV